MKNNNCVQAGLRWNTFKFQFIKESHWYGKEIYKWADESKAEVPRWNREEMGALKATHPIQSIRHFLLQ